MKTLGITSKNSGEIPECFDNQQLAASTKGKRDLPGTTLVVRSSRFGAMFGSSPSMSKLKRLGQLLFAALSKTTSWSEGTKGLVFFATFCWCWCLIFRHEDIRVRVKDAQQSSSGIKEILEKRLEILCLYLLSTSLYTNEILMFFWTKG